MALAQPSRIRNTWEFVRTSLWFVPVLMTAVGVVLAVGALLVDGRLLTSRAADFWWLRNATPEDARNLLSTLFASVVTISSLVFSITMVVLTLAANHFGTRLIRNFMGDQTTQVGLGAFMLTMAYCLVALRSIHTSVPGARVPVATVSLATLLTLVSLVLLLGFVHHIARSISADSIIGRVGRDLNDMVDRLAAAGQHHPSPQRLDAQLPDDFEEQARYMPVHCEGYVQAILYQDLAELMARHDTILHLRFRAGDFVVYDGRRIGIYPASKASDELVEAVKPLILVGTTRTPTQDVEFSIRHLVEIAVRALSPGINDPFTAMAAIDQLRASLSRMMRNPLPSPLHADREGVPRVFAAAPSYRGLLDAAFGQIRQSAADKVTVLAHLLVALGGIAEHVSRPEQLDALRTHAQMAYDAGLRAAVDAEERMELERWFKAVAAVLRGAADTVPLSTSGVSQRVEIGADRPAAAPADGGSDGGTPRRTAG